jgi:hypothetical protein
MIYAFPMLIACITAAFFCYLIANSFSTLRNRACRIVAVGCPVLLAALLFAFPFALLTPLYESLHNLGMRYRGMESFTVIVASLLGVITLLVTNLTAQIRILNKLANRQ